MRRKRISICDEFKCIGAACPANCCQGWKIPLDYDTYMKYLNAKGYFGKKLRYFTKRGEETAAFRSAFARCPFWGSDHLCEIQKKHGIEYMPAVCVQFPRQLYNLGFFCEETLYLACPEAVKLFLQYLDKDGPFDYVIMEGEVSYKVNTTNDDESFLNYLVNARDDLTAMLRTGMGFDSMAILDYGRDAQNACIRGNKLPSPLNYMSLERYQINVEMMDKLLFHGFYHPNLWVMSPVLYKLCKKYIRHFHIFRRMNIRAAEQKRVLLQQDLSLKFPEIERLLNRYYEYYLLTNFLDIYEDYSFSKCLLFGIAKTRVLQLFLALFSEDRDRLEMAEIAKVIAIYERRAPHIKDALPRL